MLASSFQPACHRLKNFLVVEETLAKQKIVDRRRCLSAQLTYAAAVQ